MTTLKETAKEYQPSQTKNIADLDFVSLGVEFQKETRTRQDGSEYEIAFVRVDGEEYRVPNSVLEQIQSIINNKPNVTKVKVVKKGEGLKTSYTTVALD